MVEHSRKIYKAKLNVVHQTSPLLCGKTKRTRNGDVRILNVSFRHFCFFNFSVIQIASVGKAINYDPFKTKTTRPFIFVDVLYNVSTYTSD